VRQLKLKVMKNQKKSFIEIDGQKIPDPKKTPKIKSYEKSKEKFY